MDLPVLIYSTAPSTEVASALAHGLVEASHAACVNLLPDITSVYRWQGAIETASEVGMFIKTAPSKVEAVKAYLSDHHPYDTPCCLVLPISDGLPDYLQWLMESTR